MKARRRLCEEGFSFESSATVGQAVKGDPKLEREYAKRGVGLIDPDAGAASFVDELLHGPADEAQVILMRGDPARLT